MVQQQILQLIFWLGIVLCIPTFYRFSYAGSALLWRKIFPARHVEIQYLDEEKKVVKRVSITLDRSGAKRVAKLLREAEHERR